MMTGDKKAIRNLRREISKVSFVFQPWTIRRWDLLLLQHCPFNCLKQ